MIEKKISIGGKEVGFKCPASFPLRYMTATSRDFFADLAILGESKDSMDKFQSTIVYDIVHQMARCYDPNIPSDKLEWIDTFDRFPVFEIFQKIQPMLVESMKTRKN